MVQKKNRVARYRDLLPELPSGSAIPILYEAPQRGYRHVVSEADLRRFIGLLPDWKELSSGLRCLILGEGDGETLGWYDEELLCLQPWHGAFHAEWGRDFVKEHEDVLERLQVPLEETDDYDWVEVRFNRQSARDFMLMHIFLHELGHHVDLMATRKRRACPGGESYAERYSETRSEALWRRYFRAFRR